MCVFFYICYDEYILSYLRTKKEKANKPSLLRILQEDYLKKQITASNILRYIPTSGYKRPNGVLLFCTENISASFQKQSTNFSYPNSYIPLLFLYNVWLIVMDYNERKPRKMRTKKEGFSLLFMFCRKNCIFLNFDTVYGCRHIFFCSSDKGNTNPLSDCLFSTFSYMIMLPMSSSYMGCYSFSLFSFCSTFS